jgi:hypothetical protein
MVRGIDPWILLQMLSWSFGQDPEEQREGEKKNREKNG